MEHYCNYFCPTWFGLINKYSLSHRKFSQNRQNFKQAHQWEKKLLGEFLVQIWIIEIRTILILMMQFFCVYKKQKNTSQMFSYVDERVSEPYRQAYGDTQNKKRFGNTIEQQFKSLRL